MRNICGVLCLGIALAVPGLVHGQTVGAGKSEIVDWDMAIVHIDRNCNADQPVVSIDAPGGERVPASRHQVLWIADKQPGDLVIISAKAPADQGGATPQARQIAAHAFENSYWIPGNKNAVTSGLPTIPPVAASVAWRYDIEIRNAAGTVVCKVDPVICIKPGGIVYDTCESY
jgi:hypothetical protein